jgi:hypothetical protein
MKNVVIGILLIAALAFGGLYLRQARTVKLAQANAEDLQQKVSELQSNVEADKQKTTQLREQLVETRVNAAERLQEAARFTDTLKENLTNQVQQAAASAQTNAKSSNPLAEMFKNPEMKELIKSQQKTALGAMIDKNYGKLFTDLHLTPEQAASLKDMILNKQLGAADLGMSMFTEDHDATKRADMAKQIKAASDTADAQIKDFLGPDNFEQFQTYEKTLGERMAVSGFKDQLSSGPTALTADQEQQLIAGMTRERQNFKFTTDFSDKSNFNGDFASMFTEDKVNVYFQELGQLNQQYLTRARDILSPEQYTAYEKYLNGQQALQKAGMQMAAKMFAPAKPGGN